MLGFRVHTNRAAFFDGLGLGQINHLLKGGHLKLAIKNHIAWANRWNTLYSAQGFELCQRQVFSEPAPDSGAVNGFRGEQRRELGAHSNVGSGFAHAPVSVADGQGVFMAGHQYTVFGSHQIRLNHVCAIVNGLRIGCKGVLGAQG